MPAAYTEQFRRRVASLVVDERVPAAGVAKHFGIAESWQRRWVGRYLVEAGKKPGVTGDEHDALVRLRRKNRVLRMERDRISRAAAIFDTENVLPRK